MRRTSRAPELLTQTPTRPYTRSTPPELQISISLYTSTSTRLQRIPRTLEANSYTFLHPQHASSSPYLDALTPAAYLQASIPLHLHIYTLAAHLHTSRALEANSYAYLHRLQTSRASEANTSTPARLQRTSRAPDLLRQTPPRPYTGSAPLEFRGS